MQQHFTNLYEYEEWANTTLINALEPIENLPARAEALMSHILLAQRIWYGRFVNDLYQGTVWDSIPRQEWLPMLQQNLSNIRRFIGTLNTPEDLQQTTTYVNMQGMKFTSTYYDILCHITHHAHYHRGQIVQLCRPQLSTAPATDYIVYARVKTGQL